MRPRSYVPQRGDLVWVTFDAPTGHEQQGRRPAVVVSPGAYNRKVGRAICCPVTGRSKGYPFEVLLPADLEIAGVILADQVRTLDWRARQATLIGALPADTVHELLQRLRTLIAD